MDFADLFGEQPDWDSMDEDGIDRVLLINVIRNMSHAYQRVIGHPARASYLRHCESRARLVCRKLEERCIEVHVDRDEPCDCGDERPLYAYNLYLYVSPTHLPLPPPTPEGSRARSYEVVDSDVELESTRLVDPVHYGVVSFYLYADELGREIVFYKNVRRYE